MKCLRNFELEQLSQGKYDIKKFIRKTKKMRDTAFEEYFKAVYPRQHSVTVDEDDECFENGEYVGPRSKSKLISCCLFAYFRVPLIFQS